MRATQGAVSVSDILATVRSSFQIGMRRLSQRW
jgi:hypothetical protein